MSISYKKIVQLVIEKPLKFLQLIKKWYQYDNKNYMKSFKYQKAF